MISTLLDNWPYFAAFLSLIAIKALWCCGFDWAFFKETTDFVIKVTAYFCLGFVEQVGSVLVPMIWPLDPDLPWCGSKQGLAKSCDEARSHGRQLGMITVIILGIVAVVIVFIVSLGSVRNWIG